MKNQWNRRQQQNKNLDCRQKKATAGVDWDILVTTTALVRISSYRWAKNESRIFFLDKNRLDRHRARWPPCFCWDQRPIACCTPHACCSDKVRNTKGEKRWVTGNRSFQDEPNSTFLKLKSTIPSEIYLFVSPRRGFVADLCFGNFWDFLWWICGRGPYHYWSHRGSQGRKGPSGRSQKLRKNRLCPSKQSLSGTMARIVEVEGIRFELRVRSWEDILELGPTNRPKAIFFDRDPLLESQMSRWVPLNGKCKFCPERLLQLGNRFGEHWVWKIHYLRTTQNTAFSALAFLTSLSQRWVLVHLENIMWFFQRHYFWKENMIFWNFFK